MRLIEKVWFDKHPAKWVLVPILAPLTLLFWLISSVRKLLFRAGFKQSFKAPVPVIVVGNISVGGNGKTPMVLWLVDYFKQKGISVGVISRGYGGVAPFYPYQVEEKSTSEQCGDEPLLIFRRTGVPVVVGADRSASISKLVDKGCQVVISDDGLQHYKMSRALELVIVDSKRLFGNGLLLPAGPLRELPSRLAEVDAVIFNGKKQTGNDNIPHPCSISMSLIGQEIVNVATKQRLSIEEFLLKFPKVQALAGIGNPQRFFDTLKENGFELSKSVGFIDHKAFSVTDFDCFSEQMPLLMTEKDAVKCYSFAKENWWSLPVDTYFSPEHQKQLSQLIEHKLNL